MFGIQLEGQLGVLGEEVTTDRTDEGNEGSEVLQTDSANDWEWELDSWIANIIQHPGTKNEVSIVLKGIQGAGKNTFTNQIAEITKGFSERNITNIEEITGQFNAVIENKMFMVLNEMKNSGEDRMPNFDQLKSVITDDTVRVNEKNQKRRTVENVCNLIFLSNNFFPVKIEASDRRYFVLIVNGKYSENKQFWKSLKNTFTPDFYKALTKFFQNWDISNYEPREIPITQAKETLMLVSQTPQDRFIRENYAVLRNGLLLDELRIMVERLPNSYVRTSNENFYRSIKERMTERCATKKEIEAAGLYYNPKNRPRFAYLREDNVNLYRNHNEEEDNNTNNDNDNDE